PSRWSWGRAMTSFPVGCPQTCRASNHPSAPFRSSDRCGVGARADNTRLILNREAIVRFAGGAVTVGIFGRTDGIDCCLGGAFVRLTPGACGTRRNVGDAGKLTNHGIGSGGASNTMAKRSAKSVFSTPAYPFAEAAHYLNLPLSTLRAWCLGQGYQSDGR